MLLLRRVGLPIAHVSETADPLSATSSTISRAENTYRDVRKTGSSSLSMAASAPLPRPFGWEAVIALSVPEIVPSAPSPQFRTIFQPTQLFTSIRRKL